MENSNEGRDKEEMASEAEVVEIDSLEKIKEGLMDEFRSFIANCDEMLRIEGLSQDIKDRIALDKKGAREELELAIEEAEKKAADRK